MNRQLADRVNKELDEMGVPSRSEERIEIFAKLIKIPRFKAESLLNGSLPLDEKLVQLLAEEFEVNPEWLTGKSDKRKN
ncbi:hypothetical protein Lade_1221 [Legionella adelaidensis]|uniref:Uncharacterized protein n=1 Tax=Legionella adelaidensis TaxID=45056 RepID=A0A0W0R678_9GAMM|nr:hypothetical protein [Legionella adelaidensis]KTC66563.1 hypothetical protein Lade_1221 [Legionella adelaidensis]